ncbi:DUF6293 family protein [Candidatus Nitrosotenuis uzonensis]|uniref:Uncharacterized protein n=1 Tax=Candidatus Nitrosotenuis uzonensis TaxID=1407055 RepID=A0A812EZF2_9ARCH|nr:DUF6293 family protein [Candidatus Nitrosotenuis uzonensis]CAE6492577.1 conserved hypothetical protein [Candidatus Nitrosotenuis uzonensis]
MSNLTTLRVHIAPVGFEIDRVVMPAKEMKADKVWLLVHEKPSEDKAGSYIEKIQKQLQREKIRVVKEYHDRLDLFNIIKSVKRIIESEQKNTLYVNLASGSKIQAIACMMACMMFNENNRIIPFYAEAERYSGFEGKQMSYGVKNLIQIPAYQIHTPRPELILALKIIRDHGGKITKKQMADIAERDHLITVNAREENLTQARFASLDKNIIQPLENQWKFVRVEKIGRNRWIELTKDGINASEFLI